VIRLRSNGQIIGSTGFGFEASDQASTGYVLAKEVWGQGYATEALAAIVDAAPPIGLARLYALCHPEHRASWRVLEKCGFARESRWSKQIEFPNLEAGTLQDVLCYGLDLKKPGAG